jgi:DnaJ family protein C protein 2
MPSGAAETQVYEVGSNPAPWTAEEQKLLEQAMRTYSANEPDRWDKIAECIPCRTKKDCMKRYKVCCLHLIVSYVVSETF